MSTRFQNAKKNNKGVFRYVLKIYNLRYVYCKFLVLTVSIGTRLKISTAKIPSIDELTKYCSLAIQRHPDSFMNDLQWAGAVVN